VREVADSCAPHHARAHPLAPPQKLAEAEVNFITANDAGEKDFSKVKANDVVVLPAFGASVQEMQLLDERDVQIVDTTCPWVSKVCSPSTAPRRWLPDAPSG